MGENHTNYLQAFQGIVTTGYAQLYQYPHDTILSHEVLSGNKKGGSSIRTKLGTSSRRLTVHVIAKHLQGFENVHLHGTLTVFKDSVHLDEQHAF
ncbi:MAG: hypothetical protein SGARI_003281, partial [Bacillariaceae sp.]